MGVQVAVRFRCDGVVGVLLLLRDVDDAFLIAGVLLSKLAYL